MADFKSIRAVIKTKLVGISGFAFVADFHDPNITAYPAVTFDIQEEQAEFLTNKENLRTIIYNIVIYQEIKARGIEDAKRIVDERATEVIDAFATDFSLGGEVDWCTPLTGPRGQFEATGGAVFFQQLNIECRFSFLTV